MYLFKKILFISIIPLFLFTSHVDNLGIVVIVNSNNTVTEMTKSEVKLTYLRKIKKRWTEINKNIIPVDRKDMPETKIIFLSKLLNMTEQDMNRYFIERQYMNAEMPPVVLTTDNEIIDYVANNIGAIGYINPNSLNAANKGKVKVVYP